MALGLVLSSGVVYVAVGLQRCASKLDTVVCFNLNFKSMTLTFFLKKNVAFIIVFRSNPMLCCCKSYATKSRLTMSKNIYTMLQGRSPPTLTCPSCPQHFHCKGGCRKHIQAKPYTNGLNSHASNQTLPHHLCYHSHLLTPFNSNGLQVSSHLTTMYTPHLLLHMEKLLTTSLILVYIVLTWNTPHFDSD